MWSFAAATVALAFSAACVILSRAGVHRVAVLGALAVAGIGVFMISSAPGIHLALGPAAFFFDAWCLATPMVIWLLARSLFMDAIEVSPALLAAMGATVLLTLAGDYGRFHLGPLAGHRERPKRCSWRDARSPSGSSSCRARWRCCTGAWIWWSNDAARGPSSWRSWAPRSSCCGLRVRVRFAGSAA
jgi:hypothetical protein